MAHGQHNTLAQLLHQGIQSRNVGPADYNIFGHHQMRRNYQFVIGQGRRVQFQTLDQIGSVDTNTKIMNEVIQFEMNFRFFIIERTV